MAIGSRTISGLLIVSMAAIPFGCATAQRNPTKTGAATGAAVGAGAGALIDQDKPWRGALIGAAVGGLAGAGVGTMVRRQRDAYNRIEQLEVQEQTVIIPESAPPAGEEPEEQEFQALTLRLQSDVLFPVGSSTLSAQGAAKIAEIAEVMKEYPQSDALVRGYTSSEGGDQMNYELSQRRAEVVRNELVANGVSPSRLTAQGMGPSNPIGDNATEAGRVMNRRVEITVIPHEQEPM